jgi:hypothetical protein
MRPSIGAGAKAMRTHSRLVPVIEVARMIQRHL